MIIWLAFLIPLCAIPVLLFFFPRRVVWWELAIPLIVSAILIPFCKFSCEAIQTRDVEYWGGWVAAAEYYEEWDEEVPCRHPKYRTETYTDSNGNTQTREVFEGYEHLYDVDYHKPRWLVHDSNGISMSINRRHFEDLAERYNNRKFVDLHRDYHSIDGDKYVTKWDKREETFTPFTSVHSYENRVQASDSVFNFQEVDPKEYGLFDYPAIQGVYGCPSILGDGGQTTSMSRKKLNILNAKFGASKQIRVWILIFTDKPMAAGIAQQNYWKNGNKNELAITIGVNSQYIVEWCHVFSWTDVEKVKVDTRSKVMEQGGQQLDLLALVSWLEPEIKQNWRRKEFADFSYLTVEPPGWMIILTYFLVILASLGSSFWVIYNKHTEPR